MAGVPNPQAMEVSSGPVSKALLPLLPEPCLLSLPLCGPLLDGIVRALVLAPAWNIV